MVMAFGVVVLGGISTVLLVPEPGVTLSELTDGGVMEDLAPVQLRCRMKLLDECRDLPDGGMRRRYFTGKLQGLYGTRSFADETGETRERGFLLLPPKYRQCVRIVGSMEEACSFVEPPDAGCTDNAVCSASTPQPEQNACACRAAAGACRRVLPDGGLGTNWPLGVTLSPGTWGGAGCVRKFCGPEQAGEGDWPEECPQQ